MSDAPSLSALADLAEAVRGRSPEELRALRLLDPTRPSEDVARLLDAHIPDNQRQALSPEYWAHLVQSMAVMASAGHVHEAGATLAETLGRVLSPFSEARFWRLLEAQGEMFYHCLRQALRTLAEAGRGVDWGDVLRLCLAQKDETTKIALGKEMGHAFCQARRETA